MTGPLSIALNGLTAASTKAAKAATNIVNAGTQNVEAVTSDEVQGVDYTQDIVDLKEAATAYKANIVVAKVASEMEKELLNRFDETV